MPTIDMTTVKQIMHGDKEVIKIEDSLGNIMWQKAGPTPAEASQYKFEDVTPGTVYQFDALAYQAVNSFCCVKTHNTSTSSDATAVLALNNTRPRDVIAENAGYDRKFYFVKTDVIKYDVTNATNFYVKCQSTSNSSARTFTISDGNTTVTATAAVVGSITTCTLPCSNFTGTITITNGTGNVDIYEMGYTS